MTRMEVRYTEPHMIDCRKPPNLTVYVVMGDTDHAGCIKPIKVGYGQVCPYVKGDWRDDQEGNHHVTELRIPLHYAKRGWFFLDRAYDEEGNTHGKQQWHDFQKACKRRRAFHKKDDDRIVPGFPDELLPKAVRDCIARRDPKLEAWEPTMPEKREAKAKG